MNTHLDELINRWREGRLSDEDLRRLTEALDTPEGRASLRANWFLEAALPEALRTSPLLRVSRKAEPQQTRKWTGWLSWRPLAAAAAGLVFGMFCTSLVWAVSSPRTTTKRLFSLINGSFDEAHIEHSFPHQTGVWSGDEAAITDGRLRFIKPESDPSDPDGRAIACDVFQLVDLRSLRRTSGPVGEAVLELNARFADERPHNTNPSITFFCQLYLFQGDPTQMHQSWPKNIPDALASGSAQVTTLGSDNKGSRQVTARCLVPADADFAVIQIAARPNLRPAKLHGLFADDVTLTLKTSPELPIRIVQR